jgi:hypothetical protein
MIDKREITPELLTKLTVVLFKNIHVGDVLRRELRFDKLSAVDVRRIMLKDEEFIRSRSEESCESLARSVIDYVYQRTEWQYNRLGTSPDWLNVFDLLLLTVQDLLTMSNNQFTCRYEQIMSWRMIVRYLGEEVALSAKYAQWDHDHNRAIRDRVDDFIWPYLTKHNNKQLNMVMRRGISEHHCHLWASTPHFHVSWINLMNRMTDETYLEGLRKFNPHKWSKDEGIPLKRTKKDSAFDYYGELAHIRAAWIRLYLAEKLCGKTTADRRYYDLRNVRDYDRWSELLRSRDRLESEINAYAHQGDHQIDYILNVAQLKKSSFAEDYQPLIGERWLYYQVFRDYARPLQQRILSDDDYNLFFVYLLIRLWLRKKMVQNNDFMGFDNFQRIERRKAYFLDDPYSERALIRLAINESLKKDYLKEMEVRISPEPNQIKRLEKYINSSQRADPVDEFLSRRAGDGERVDLRQRYYYVFHFLKRTDSLNTKDPSYQRSIKTRRICRHMELRQKFLNEAKEIISFREDSPNYAKRVLGIDAASKEIGCRPEVLGTVFRLLGDHKFTYGGYMEPKQALPALRKTFHVGEDFADVVDGLRAIDEVIHFLDFDCGDRLGHALALGVNVDDWYEQKNREIAVSVQDYLDNLAWLYHALTHFDVRDTGSLKDRLERDFKYWFRIVYRNSFDKDDVQRLVESAKEYYRRTGEDHLRYHEHSDDYGIMDYYRAWMLRGDDPSCYIDGYFKKPSGNLLSVVEQQARICMNFPPNFEDRYISEYSFLNYLYQFDYRVKQEGLKKIKIDLSQEYIDAVKAVQCEMRYRIARRGIAIETNPTSNVMIGTFRDYGKHPILTFYNRGLPVTDEEEDACAQIQVSINTDDSGVFYTDLETEYALVAKAVEQIVDDSNRPRFKKADIYTWLDNIRVMGNEQTFNTGND